MDIDVTNFETVFDIDKAMDALRQHRKAVKDAQDKRQREQRKARKEQKMAEAKEHIESLELMEGETITFTLKGERTEGQFVKVTESRFVAEVDGVKKTLQFDKFLGRVNEETQVA